MPDAAALSELSVDVLFVATSILSFEKVLRALQKHARVTCGYAAVKDVRTLQHEDRMDSFVLSETFKYLYLLFAKDEDLFLDMHQVGTGFDWIVYTIQYAFCHQISPPISI